jgi:hypothetical protein
LDVAQTTQGAHRGAVSMSHRGREVARRAAKCGEATPSRARDATFRDACGGFYREK